MADTLPIKFTELLQVRFPPHGRTHLIMAELTDDFS